MIIYKITNTINNKIYIGQTINTLKTRWRRHCNKNNKCPAIKRAIQKYGKDKFTIEEIDRAKTLDELNEKEIYWINFYDSMNKQNGYNLSVGGKGTHTTEETRKKLSKLSKGKPMSEGTRKALREAERIITDDIRKNIINAQRTRRLKELETNPMQFIAKERKRWRVVVFKKYVGSSNSLEIAKELRDEYIKKLDKNNELMVK